MNVHQQKQNQAISLASKKRAYGLVEFTLTLVFLVAALAFSSTIANWVNNLSAFWSATLYFVIMAGAYFLILFPVQYAKNYRLPKDFGLLKQNFTGWLGSYVKIPLLTLALGGLAFGLLFGLINANANWWWFWAALAVAAFSFILSTLFPFWVLPLLYKNHTLPSGELKRELDLLISKSKVSLSRVDILEVSSEEESANAMLMGWGRNRRLCFSDTLMRDYSIAEIKVITAHELGHAKKGHFGLTWVVSLLIVMVVLFLTHLLSGLIFRWLDLGEITALSNMPIIVLLFFVLYSVFAVLSNFYSRYQERQADLYALGLTQDPQAFLSMLQKITNQNLEEENPHPLVEKLLYDHPSSASRQKMAQAFKPDNPY